MAQAWEQALVSYKTDPAAAAAEIARAQGVYTAQKAAGNTAAADAAHLWANQIRLATGTSTQYNDVTGAPIATAGQPVVVTPVPTVPTVPTPTPVPTYTPTPTPTYVPSTYVPPASIPAPAPAVMEPYTGTPVQPTIVQPPVQPAPAPMTAPAPTAAAVYTGTPAQPYVVQPYVEPTPVPMPTAAAVAANQVAQTAYYQAANALANDSTMMKAFLAENPWASPDNNQWDQSTAAAFSSWSDSYVQQISGQSILDGVRFDATKEPWWPSYVDMLTSRDALTKASLKTALDLKVNATQAQQGMATAEYNFQVSEIDNALNLANWATKEEMATGNVFIAGALNWAVSQNEAKGLNDKSLAREQRGATIAKLANDITILTSDYANQGTLMDAATIAEIGAKREYFLSGNIDQYNTAMALVKTLQGAREAINIAAPGAVKAGQAAATTATKNQNMQTAAFLAGLVQQGIYLTQNNDGTYGYKTGLTADQQLNVNTQLFNQWYQTQGINLSAAQLASDQAQQQFTNWLATQGLNLNISQQNWQQTVDTANQQLAVNTQLFDQWYNTQGINLNYAQLASNETQQKFENWATTQGLNLNMAQFNWGQVVDTATMNVNANQQAFNQWYQTEGVKLSAVQLASDQGQRQFENWATTQGLDLNVAQFDWNKYVDQAGINVNQQNANLNQQQFDWAKSTDAASIYGQYGITFKTDTTGKITGMNRVPTPSEALAIQNSAYDYWYKKQSVAQNWRQLTDAAKQNQFSNWATSQGLSIDRSSLAETIRSHKVSEAIDWTNAATAATNAAGGAGETNAPVYDPSDDRALVGSANFIPSGAGSAPYLRLGAYSGAMTSTDAALKDFFYGGTTVVTPATTVGKVTTPAVTQAYTGLNAMNQTDAAAIVRLIPDDVRAGEVWAMYAAGHNLGTATATFNSYATQNKLTPAQIASGLGFLSQIRGGQ